MTGAQASIWPGGGYLRLDGGCASPPEVSAAEVLAATHRSEDLAGEALAFEQMGEMTWRWSDICAATPRHGQALELRAAVGDWAAIATSLEVLATLAAACKDLPVSARLFGAAASLRARDGSATSESLRADHAANTEATRAPLGQGAFEAEGWAGASLPTRAALSLSLRNSIPKRPRQTAGQDRLTSAECRVAELVAEGLTNAQIALRLGRKEPTVRTHLRHIFDKWGVRTRSAMAAEFRRRVPAPSEGDG